VTAPISTAEDLIVYKAGAWRDRDRSDIQRLLLLHASSVDLAAVRDLVAQFAGALEEPERIPAFDELVQRTLGGGD
jgi:hypothetical protein